MPNHPSDKKPTLPHYHKRAFSHNYHAPFIYHIILKKAQICESFGTVKGDARIASGNPGCAYIQETLLGRVIAKAILSLQYAFPILQIYQFIIMPDHIHILLRVREWSERHLDYYIGRLIYNIGIKYSKFTVKEICGEEIFQPGYCDKPLLIKRSLDGLFRYIRENPHRLAMRQQFPHFFQRVRKLRIGEKDYEAYGNLFLIRNPDKAAVKISRKFTLEEKLQKQSRWLSDAAKGTVLVSPFISQEEKAIRTQAELTSGKLILIIHETFGERYKPAKHDFDLCSEGRVLIISLGLPPQTPLSREICNQMNNLSQLIANL